MNDDIVTRLPLETVCELVYWNLRAVMENAKDCVPSPNPIWGYMNELYDDVMRLEDALNIPNRMESQ